MIRVMLAKYSGKEVDLLTQIFRDGIQRIRYHCDDIGSICGICQYKHLCEDLTSTEMYLSNTVQGRGSTRKRYKKSE